jgi:hypothetical protein
VGATVIYCNSWGGPHFYLWVKIQMLGGSGIFSPDGRIVTATTEGEQVFVHEIESGNSSPQDDNEPWPLPGPGERFVTIERVLTNAAGKMRAAHAYATKWLAR